MSEQADWEILERWESDIGVYIRVRSSTGETTTKNFNKAGFTEDRAERNIQRWHEACVENQEKPSENKKLKVGYKKPKKE